MQLLKLKLKISKYYFSKRAFYKRYTAIITLLQKSCITKSTTIHFNVFCNEIKVYAREPLFHTLYGKEVLIWHL